ncbi:MAG TPA: helix-turn-helix transcriptional regulator [Melioribacteraceae bacterium]|nr:helix-turn-helix transcriptional regulator [Melioribacteraceae bacterium]
MRKNLELINIIAASGINPKIIADTLGTSLTSLNHLLSSPNLITEQLKEKILKIIDEYQSELRLFKEETDIDTDIFEDAEFQKILGERIKIFAKQRYNTLKELATALDISPQQLNQYTTGKREPGCKILSKLLDLGCDINWLLSGNKISESYKIITLENQVKELKETLTEIIKVAGKGL